MTKILALIFVFATMVGGNVLTMIYGWDLEPKSWWWIIGWGVFGQIFMKMVGDKVIEEK